MGGLGVAGPEKLDRVWGRAPDLWLCLRNTSRAIFGLLRKAGQMKWATAGFRASLPRPPLSLIVADRCVDPVQARSPFLRFPILQVGIDELQPRSIGVGQSRHARVKELLRSPDRQDIRILVDVPPVGFIRRRAA